MRQRIHATFLQPYHLKIVFPNSNIKRYCVPLRCSDAMYNVQKETQKHKCADARTRGPYEWVHNGSYQYEGECLTCGMEHRVVHFSHFVDSKVPFHDVQQHTRTEHARHPVKFGHGYHRLRQRMKLFLLVGENDVTIRSEGNFFIQPSNNNTWYGLGKPPEKVHGQGRACAL